MEIINHIETREGQAYIRGTNKKAEMIARMYVGTDYSIEEVMEHYNLSYAEVPAALAYYYDNQQALDTRHQEALQWAEKNALTLDTFKTKLAARQQNDDPQS